MHDALRIWIKMKSKKTLARRAQKKLSDKRKRGEPTPDEERQEERKEKGAASKGINLYSEKKGLAKREKLQLNRGDSKRREQIRPGISTETRKPSSKGRKAGRVSRRGGRL